MMAIGTIAARTGNELAFQLLADESLSGDPAREQAAALGLGLSGEPVAVQMLNDRAGTESDIQRKRTLMQAAKENGRVAQHGLRQYYLQPWVPLSPKSAETGEGGKE